MKKEEIENLIKNKEKLNQKIERYKKRKIIRKQNIDTNEIKGHIEKAEHNLSFIKDNLKLGYTDWSITGCYYAVYQASLALIGYKKYSSKNHDATLTILMKEYYGEGIEKEDIELVNNFFLDYNDLLIYTEAKDRREEASYSTKYLFDKDDVEKLRKKAIAFVDKAKNLLGGIFEE